MQRDEVLRLGEMGLVYEVATRVMGWPVVEGSHGMRPARPYVMRYPNGHNVYTPESNCWSPVDNWQHAMEIRAVLGVGSIRERLEEIAYMARSRLGTSLPTIYSLAAYVEPIDICRAVLVTDDRKERHHGNQT